MGCTRHTSYEAVGGLVVRSARIIEGGRLASESVISYAVPP